MNHRPRRRPRVEQLETRRLLAYAISNLGQDAVLGDMKGDWLVYGVDEDDQGDIDLNGDGDIDDRVLHVHQLSTGTTTNLALANTNARVSVVDDLVVFLVDERDQANTDLNGDGDVSDDVLHVYDAVSGQVTNTGIESGNNRFQLADDLLALLVDEYEQGGLDLNGDGDTEDTVAQVYDLNTGTTTNLGLAAGSLEFDGDHMVFAVSESRQGDSDLNGDGDTSDTVVHVYDTNTATITNLGLARGLARYPGPFPRIYALDGNHLAFNVGEADNANTDLNGDGDATDNVLHVIDLASGSISNLELAVLDYAVDNGHIALEVREADQGGTDLNGDGVVSLYDRVLHLHDLESDATQNLQLSTSSDSLSFVDFAFVDDVIVVPAAERTLHDLNGDGDTSDYVLQKVDMNGLITNTGVSARELIVSGHRVAFRVREGSQGSTDLNGDGDIADYAMGIYDVQSDVLTILPYDAEDLGFQLSDSHLAFNVSETNQGFQDLNGDGDTRDRVLHVHDFALAATTNFAVQVSPGYYRLDGDQMAYNVAERSRGDLNGDGDSSDSVLHVATLRADPVVLIFEQLEQSIGDLNLSSGIENSLSVKLLGALKSYQQDTGGGDPAITNKLEALIQAIEAQRDKRIASADADQLIADIRTAIVLIQASVT